MSNLTAYRSKTDAELHFIIKDAHEAADAVRGHDPVAEAKYLDQINDACTTLNARRQGRSLASTASWILRNKATGEVVCETFERAMVDALNTAKYEAVPILEYLGSLNRKGA